MKHHEFDKLMTELCKAVEKATGSKFNTILINRYDSGDDYISLHRDKTDNWVEDSGVATLCLCNGNKVREF